MSTELHHFIDGRPEAGPGGRSAEVYDPATGRVTARVPLAGGSQTRAAVMAARRALPGWAATTPL
ncbi:MAG TPA: aldehyde dehydrogenase family protein, partial [Gammaproteobacteria bacterium]|nr:aldehyde dehydrogenase family protein [Gammaproteobacteria bacterium]